MDYRQRVASALESRWGKTLFVLLIMMSAIAIGLETDPDIEREDAAMLHAFDRMVLTVFTVEIALRIFVARSLRAYLRDPWNVFDLLIVGCCWRSQSRSGRH